MGAPHSPAAQVEPLPALIPFLSMPVCRKCLHRGAEHDWSVPECSRCGRRDLGCPDCRRNRERGRVRGACLVRGTNGRCICSKYEPLSDQRTPVNRFAGRILSRKRR
jgi:hypothetical protein